MSSPAYNTTISALLFAATIVITLIVVLPMGSGVNQQITENFLAEKLHAGMSAQEAGYSVALDYLETIDQGADNFVSVLAKSGYCSILWPQRHVELEFVKGRLTKVRVKTVFRSGFTEIEIPLSADVKAST